MYNGQCHGCIYNTHKETCAVCEQFSMGTVGAFFRSKSCELCTNHTFCSNNEKVCSSLNLNQFILNEEICPDVDTELMNKLATKGVPLAAETQKDSRIEAPEKTTGVTTPATPVTTISGQNTELSGGTELTYAEAHKRVFRKQVGGDHYKTEGLPPGFPDVAEFCAVHHVGFPEGCVIKYAFRHNKAEDILKAMQYLQFIALVHYKKYVEIRSDFKVV